MMIDLFEFPGFELASARNSCGRDRPPSPSAPILRKLRRAIPSQNWLDGLPSRVSMAGSEKGGEQNRADCWVRSWQEWCSVSNPQPNTIHLWMLIDSIEHAFNARRAAVLKTNFQLTVIGARLAPGTVKIWRFSAKNGCFFHFSRQGLDDRFGIINFTRVVGIRA